MEVVEAAKEVARANALWVNIPQKEQPGAFQYSGPGAALTSSAASQHSQSKKQSCHPVAGSSQTDGTPAVDNSSIQGDNLIKFSIKSGHNLLGGAHHKRVDIIWHQEAFFIGPDKRRVKYDEFTQSQ